MGDPLDLYRQLPGWKLPRSRWGTPGRRELCLVAFATGQAYLRREWPQDRTHDELMVVIGKLAAHLGR